MPRIRLITFVLLGLSIPLVISALDLDGNGIDDACESSTLSSNVTGDPHFVGFHGQRFDFDGIPFRTYHLFSLSDLVSVNARFVPDGRWKGQTVMGELGVVSSAQNLHIRCSNSSLLVSMNGVDIPVSEPLPFGNEGMISFAPSRSEMTVSVGGSSVDIVRHKTRNLQCFLDVSVQYASASESEELPGGILGSTADADFDAASLTPESFLVETDNIFSTHGSVSGSRQLLWKNGSNGKVVRISRTLSQAGEASGCGCTNSSALNFDSTALLEDGSCLYVDPSSSVGAILLEGDCSAVDESELIEALASVMEVSPSEIDILSVTCAPLVTRRRHRSVRRLLAAAASPGTIELVFEVAESARDKMHAFMSEVDAGSGGNGTTNGTQSDVIPVEEVYLGVMQRTIVPLNTSDPEGTVSVSSTTGATTMVQSSFSVLRVLGRAAVNRPVRTEAYAASNPCRDSEGNGRCGDDRGCKALPDGGHECLCIKGLEERDVLTGKCLRVPDAPPKPYERCEDTICAENPEGFTNCAIVNGFPECFSSRTAPSHYCPPSGCSTSDTPFPRPAPPSMNVDATFRETLFSVPCGVNHCQHRTDGYHECCVVGNPPRGECCNIAGDLYDPNDLGYNCGDFDYSDYGYCASNPCLLHPDGMHNCVQVNGVPRCYATNPMVSCSQYGCPSPNAICSVQEEHGLYGFGYSLSAPRQPIEVLSFPMDLHAMLAICRQFQMRKFQYNPRQGIANLRCHPDTSSLVACGKGGPFAVTGTIGCLQLP